MCNLRLPFDGLGPVLNLAIGVSEVRTEVLRKEGKAIPSSLILRGLVDTGADGIALDIEHLQALGIPNRGFEPVHTMDGKKYCQRFDVSLTLHMEGDKELFLEAEPCLAFRNLKHRGFDLLIGRQVLDRFVFILDGPRKMFELKYADPPQI